MLVCVCMRPCLCYPACGISTLHRVLTSPDSKLPPSWERAGWLGHPAASHPLREHIAQATMRGTACTLWITTMARSDLICSIAGTTPRRPRCVGGHTGRSWGAFAQMCLPRGLRCLGQRPCHWRLGSQAGPGSARVVCRRRKQQPASARPLACAPSAPHLQLRTCRCAPGQPAPPCCAANRA